MWVVYVTKQIAGSLVLVLYYTWGILSMMTRCYLWSMGLAFGLSVVS